MSEMHRIPCPECGKRLKISAEQLAAGTSKTGSCPACGHVMSVDYLLECLPHPPGTVTPQKEAELDETATEEVLDDVPDATDETVMDAEEVDLFETLVTEGGEQGFSINLNAADDEHVKKGSQWTWSRFSSAPVQRLVTNGLLVIGFIGMCVWALILNSRIAEMKGTIDEIGSHVSGIQSDASWIETYVNRIESDVSSIESDVSSIQSDVSSIESDVSRIR